MDNDLMQAWQGLYDAVMKLDGIEVSVSITKTGTVLKVGPFEHGTDHAIAFCEVFCETEEEEDAK
jgi:hypothetical protein